MRNTNSIVGSALFIFALVGACDLPRDASPAITPRVLPDTDYWTDGDKGCEGHLFKTEHGAMCAPPCGDPACDLPLVDACSVNVGGPAVCVAFDSCGYLCQTDSECAPGQRCDPEQDICVWENFPGGCIDEACGVGEAFGPCGPGNTCEGVMTCQTAYDGTAIGHYCAPPCAVCDADPAVNICLAGLSDFPPVCIDDVCRPTCLSKDDCNNGAECLAGECAWIP